MSERALTIEFPDFGFGPAVTGMRVLTRLMPRWRCNVASTGAALGLVRRALPWVEALDVDTFDPGCMSSFECHVDADCFVVSVTNPGFASRAARAGYRVGVVDTLRWMWDDETAAVDGAAFYVAQHYWGRRGSERRQGEVLAAAHTIEYGRSASARPRSRRALVAFGGMSLPLDGTLPLEFADWVIACAVPVLLEDPAIDGVDVVGGHPQLAELCQRRERDPAVRGIGMLPPGEYLTLLRSAPVVLATPGIATVHELQWAKSRALLLPGSNVSQVLQLRDAVEGFGYDHVLEWPSAHVLADAIRGLRERGGMEHVAAVARDAMANPRTGRALTAAIQRRLADERPLPRFPDAPGAAGLPRVDDVVAELVAAQIGRPLKSVRRSSAPLRLGRLSPHLGA